jgi:hypothetical protein
MITQEQIQAIVDGECSHEVRAVLLRQMDVEPTTWRRLALSLLEEQEWARQFSVMAKCDPLKSRSTDSSSDPGSKQNELMDLPSSSQSLVTLADNFAVEGRARSLSWLSVLAASLLLGLGFYGGSHLPRFDGPDSKDTTGGVATMLNHPSRADRSELVAQDMSETNMRMLVSGPNKETSEIPIYDLNTMDHDVFVAKQALEIARLNQQLRKEGFEVDVRPEYYTGKLHDGRKLIVPVKHVGLKPYGL